MAGGGEAINPDEFAGWVPVREAHEALAKAFGYTVAAQTILRRLSSEVLVAGADRGIWTDPDRQRREERLTTISPVIWQKFEPGYDHAFWRTGDAEVYFATERLGGYEISIRNIGQVMFFGVRFERAGLNEIAPLFGSELARTDTVQPSAADLTSSTAHERELETMRLKASKPEAATLVSTAPQKALKNLPPVEYQNLSRAIVSGWGATLTEDQAWNMAKRMFPEHNVRRGEFLARYKQDRGQKKPGKQPSRH